MQLLPKPLNCEVKTLNLYAIAVQISDLRWCLTSLMEVNVTGCIFNSHEFNSPRLVIVN